MTMIETDTLQPLEVFPPWRAAQDEVDRRLLEAPLSPFVLRANGFLRPEVAESVSEWYTEEPAPTTDAVRRAYGALERETGRLFGVVQRSLGVRIRYARTADEPYDAAAELCAELRERRTMTLRTIACDTPHPLLGGVQGGVVDQLRVVHDVFGHAALGLGFDLQSEYATWLQCRALFSPRARPAAFCELVGAVTAYVTTGEKPSLVATLPPARWVASPHVVR
jgi:hypothetical protein